MIFFLEDLLEKGMGNRDNVCIVQSINSYKINGYFTLINNCL